MCGKGEHTEEGKTLEYRERELIRTTKHSILYKYSMELSKIIKPQKVMWFGLILRKWE